MALTYPAYCKKCEIESKGKISLPGHRRVSLTKTECLRCHTIKPVPFKRWIAGALFFAFMFGTVAYFIYMPLVMLWPLFEMPFKDYETGEMTFALLLVPGYYVYARIVGKVIK